MDYICDRCEWPRIYCTCAGPQTRSLKATNANREIIHAERRQEIHDGYTMDAKMRYRQRRVKR